MTPHDIALVRESFAHLHRRKAQTGQIFYDRLFVIAPDTRPLFKGDMAAQGMKLMEMLTVALAALNDPEGLTALLKRLGRSHDGYGVAHEHYAKVGDALQWTLKTSLGPLHTPEIGRAWSEIYGHMAEIMIGGSRKS